MTYLHNNNYQLRIPDLIQNPIYTLSDTIFLLTREFFYTRWPRFCF